MLFGVGNRKSPTTNSQLGGELRRLVMQNNLGLAAARPRHFDIEPADFSTPAAAERLHHRLLGGKPPGITLILAALLLFAVSNLAGSEHPVAKTLADARVLDGR